MKTGTVAAVFVTIFLFQGASKGNTCKEVTDEVITKHLALETFTVMSRRELNGLCEVIINTENRVISFYGNKKFLISGEMYENGSSLTESMLYDINKSLLKSSISEVESCAVFTYLPAEVKTEKTLYMFTDPLCPFCNRIGGEIKVLSDRVGFKVKVLLLNVHGEKGRERCIEAVCRNSVNPSFNFIEYNKPEWKKSDTKKEFICPKGSEVVDKTEKLSEKLGIDSVPFFFVNDGRHVSGASIEDVELLFNAGE